MARKKNENQYTPDQVSPPSETIVEMMAERGMTPNELAAKSHLSVLVVESLLRDEIEISVELARGLEDALGVPFAFWIARSGNYWDQKWRSVPPHA